MPAFAQAGGDATSRPVVQPLPSPAVANLEAALLQLGSNPRDVNSLVKAGSASLELGDTDAAIGFFSRAGELAPSDPRPKVGMGAALVRSENPYDALLMFEEAERYGASSDLLAGDRGLAWDLVGDNTQAQAFYRQALARGRNDEVTRRLALSLAISGNRREAEKTLQPLLDVGDPAARRVRAFVLAISGDSKSATDVAQQSMPRNLADKISPYLRYMPRLTPAQQAAAANFGHFPNTADIGKDDPRVAKYNKDGTKRVASAADATLVPQGEPLGGAKKPSRREQRDMERRQLADAAQQKATQEAAARKQAELARAEEQRKAQLAAAEQVRAAAAAQEQARVAAAQERARLAARAQSVAPAAPVNAGAAAAPATAAAMARSSSIPASTSPPGELPPLPGTAGTASVSQDTAGHSFSLTSPANGAGQAAPVASAAAPLPSSWSLPSQTRADETGASQIASFGVEHSALPGQSIPDRESPSVAAGQGVAQASLAPTAAVQPAAPPAQYSPPVPPPPLPPPAAQTAASAAPAAPRAPLSVADAFADLAVAKAGPGVASGAVDITKIKPRREEPPKPKEPPPPPKPAYPSRVWVQVGTGRDTGALAFDWRRLNKDKAELFKSHKPYVARWGQTNRMVTGPFDSAKAAQDFVSKLKTAGVNSFIFTSDEGEAVEPLGK
jgi:Flp pilus assembly protein TadD